MKRVPVVKFPCRQHPDVSKLPHKFIAHLGYLARQKEGERLMNSPDLATRERGAKYFFEGYLGVCKMCGMKPMFTAHELGVKEP